MTQISDGSPVSISSQEPLEGKVRKPCQRRRWVCSGSGNLGYIIFLMICHSNTEKLPKNTNGLLTNWNALTQSSVRVFRHLMLRTTIRLQMRTTDREKIPLIISDNHTEHTCLSRTPATGSIVFPPFTFVTYRSLKVPNTKT